MGIVETVEIVEGVGNGSPPSADKSSYGGQE